MRKLTQRTYTLGVREAAAIVVYARQSSWSTEDLLRHLVLDYADVDVVALELIFEVWGAMRMARGKGTAGKAQDNGWTRFVEVSMAGVTQADIQDEFSDPEEIANKLDELLRGGYRLGLSYNDGRHSFTVSLTCRDESSPNYGCTMTSFAGTWYQAVVVALYKHYVVAKEDWGSGSQQGSEAAFG